MSDLSKRFAAALLAVAAAGLSVLLLIWSEPPHRGAGDRPDGGAVRPASLGPSESGSAVWPPEDATPEPLSPEEEAAAQLRRLEHHLDDYPPELGGGRFLFEYDGFEYLGLDFSRLDEFPGIRAASGDAFPEDAWKSFKHQPQLELLEQRSGYVTNESLACLKSLTRLEVLRLSSSLDRSVSDVPRSRRPPSLSAVALEPVRDMPHLRELSLSSDNLTDEGFERIAAAEGLLTLSLSGFFTDEGLRHVGKLKGLKRLSLSGKFGDEGLRHLEMLTELEILDLSSPNLRGPGLARLAALPNLRYLRVGAVPDLSLAGLEGWPALEVLDLGNEATTDALLATFPPLPPLDSLSLEGASVGDGGMRALTRLTGLSELNLRFTDVTDAGLKTIADAPAFQDGLRVLCLGEGNVYSGSPEITQAGLERLAQLRRLEGLDLRYVNLVEPDLQVLALPSLRRLNIEGILGHRSDEVRRLLERAPLLGQLTRNLGNRIMIRADLFQERDLTAYDFLTDRLRVRL